MTMSTDEYRPVSHSVIANFIAALNHGEDEGRITKIRVDLHVVTLTMLRIDERGRYFVDPQTGRPAEEYIVMPVMR